MTSHRPSPKPSKFNVYLGVSHKAPQSGWAAIVHKTGGDGSVERLEPLLGKVVDAKSSFDLGISAATTVIEQLRKLDADVAVNLYAPTHVVTGMTEWFQKWEAEGFVKTRKLVAVNMNYWEDPMSERIEFDFEAFTETRPHIEKWKALALASVSHGNVEFLLVASNDNQAAQAIDEAKALARSEVGAKTKRKARRAVPNDRSDQ